MRADFELIKNYAHLSVDQSRCPFVTCMNHVCANETDSNFVSSSKEFALPVSVYEKS